MSCFTKYISHPVVSFLAGVAVGVGSTYYYNNYTTQTTTQGNEKHCENKSEKNEKDDKVSGKVITV